MKQRLKILSLIILFPFIASYSQGFYGKVVKILDGDTFDMLTENGTIRVRIYGIDAPEKSQAFGRVSKEYLSKLIGGISVKVLVSNKDRYGRYNCRVYSEEKDISYEMLKAGLAWLYKRFDNSDQYSQAEKTAKTNKVGLWKDSNPIRPWQYRKKN